MADTTLKSLHVRITPPSEDLIGPWTELLAKAMDGTVTNYFFVQETDAAHTHMQGVVQTTLKMEAFRQRLTRANPDLKGNKVYSMSTVRSDLDSFYRYLCKESPPKVILRCGLDFTDEWVSEKHVAYHEYAEQRCKRKKGKDAKASLEQFAEDCMMMQAKTREAVAELYCQRQVQMHRGITVHAARAAVNYVMFKNGTSDDKKYIVSTIAQYI